jgi:hypothetical protein
MGVGLLDPKGVHSAVSNLVANAIQACNTATGRDRHHVTIDGRLKTQTFYPSGDDGIEFRGT